MGRDRIGVGRQRGIALCPPRRASGGGCGDFWYTLEVDILVLNGRAEELDNYGKD